MSPGVIAAGVFLASVPVWSLKVGLVLALAPVSGALLVGLFLVFGRRGGEWAPEEFRALPAGARVRLLCAHGALDWRLGRVFFAGTVGAVGPLLVAPECCRHTLYRHVDFARPDGAVAGDDWLRTTAIPENVESVP